ncbi:unnamed protein product, partial [Iphiclides podalirius]
MDLSPDEDHFQGRLLHQAALWDNVELLQELVATGADVDARDRSGRTALHAAALLEGGRCLAALCSAGAELDARSDVQTGGKISAFKWGMFRTYPSWTLVPLKRKLCINSLLRHVSQFTCSPIARLMGATLTTALHLAAERGHAENVALLLSAGAQVDAADAGGETALALAERGCHRRTARLLRDATVLTSPNILVVCRRSSQLKSSRRQGFVRHVVRQEGMAPNRPAPPPHDGIYRRRGLKADFPPSGLVPDCVLRRYYRLFDMQPFRRRLVNAYLDI